MAPPKGLEPLTYWLTVSCTTGLCNGGKPLFSLLSVSQDYLSLAMPPEKTIGKSRLNWPNSGVFNYIGGVTSRAKIIEDIQSQLKGQKKEISPLITPNKGKQTNNRSKSNEKSPSEVSSIHIIPAMSPAIRPQIVFAMGLTIIAPYDCFFRYCAIPSVGF